MKINLTASWMVIVTLTIVALIVGQSILIPFIVALLIWFVVKKTRNMLDRIEFMRTYIPKWVKTLVASIIAFSLLLLVGQLLMTNIEKLAMSYERYASNIEIISAKVDLTFGINLQEKMSAFLYNINFSSYFKSLFNSISGIFGNMIMIAFYTVFMFIEEGLFRHKINLVVGTGKKAARFHGVLLKIDKMMSRYLILKSLMNLLNAAIAFIVLIIVGIDSPFFWSALIFFFGFIPSIGPIFGTLLPALFSLVQFADFAPFFIILLVIGTFEVLIGNYLEPRIMGNTLNISPLFGIFALALWGSIWGVTGMLLSVPITVAMIIIMAQFPNTRNIAILMSEKGKV